MRYGSLSEVCVLNSIFRTRILSHLTLLFMVVRSMCSLSNFVETAKTGDTLKDVPAVVSTHDAVVADHSTHPGSASLDTTHDTPATTPSVSVSAAVSPSMPESAHTDSTSALAVAAVAVPTASPVSPPATLSPAAEAAHHAPAAEHDAPVSVAAAAAPSVPASVPEPPAAAAPSHDSHPSAAVTKAAGPTTTSGVAQSVVYKHRAAEFGVKTNSVAMKMVRVFFSALFPLTAVRDSLRAVCITMCTTSTATFWATAACCRWRRLSNLTPR